MNTANRAAWILLAAAALLALLLALPAAAQDSSATSSTLYLPAVARNFAMWFTGTELEAAQAAAGYDVTEASMHTVCVLDPSSTPPDDLRYSSCEQYWVDGVATEGTGHYIWWLRLNDGLLHGLEIGG